MRDTFARVSIYRQMCESVRSGSNGTLFSGVFMIGLGYLNYTALGAHPIAYLLVGIGILEIGVGLLKKIRPSPECVLFDALLTLAFAGSIFLRQYLAFQAGNKVNNISLFIGAWCLFNAYQLFSQYQALRRLFIERPSADQLAYVDDLVAEIIESDPETDPTALYLPSKPRIKAKLLDGVALLVVGPKKEFGVTATDDMELERIDNEGGPTAYLRIGEKDFGTVSLKGKNWQNYVQWKTDHGDPPPPPVARSRDERDE